MGSFILEENTKFIILRGYPSGVMSGFKEWQKENIGCEILEWKQNSVSQSSEMHLSIMYNPPNKELDDILK